jgi:hypothetical protein
VIRLQRAIPKINVTFDKAACLTPGPPINYCMVYCSARPTHHSHFIVRAMLEEWLINAREPYTRARPQIMLRFDHTSAAERDAIFQNGYSLLHHHPGIGPMVNWGYPGDVSLLDLMGLATVIKTFEHEFENDLKFKIAGTLQCSLDTDDLLRSRHMVHERMREISDTAIAHRIAYGRGRLYVPPENTLEDEYFHIEWHSMTARPYVVRVDFENFELKYTVPQKLIDLFGSCFGYDLTYRMVPQGE